MKYERVLSDQELSDAKVAICGDEAAVAAWLDAQVTSWLAQCAATRRSKRLAAVGLSATGLTDDEVATLCAPREAEKEAARLAAEAEAARLAAEAEAARLAAEAEAAPAE